MRTRDRLFLVEVRTRDRLFLVFVYLVLLLVIITISTVAIHISVANPQPIGWEYQSAEKTQNFTRFAAWHRNVAVALVLNDQGCLKLTVPEGERFTRGDAWFIGRLLTFYAESKPHRLPTPEEVSGT